MKALIEVDFPSKEKARVAVKALEQEGGRAELSARAVESLVVVEVKASDFTSLRARTTSALRDLKVIMDAVKLKG